MKSLFLMFLFAVTSCSQTKKFYYAEQINARDGKTKSLGEETDTGLLIKGKYDDKFSETYFGFIHFVFENKTDNGLR